MRNPEIQDTLIAIKEALEEHGADAVEMVSAHLAAERWADLSEAGDAGVKLAGLDRKAVIAELLDAYLNEDGKGTGAKNGAAAGGAVPKVRNRDIMIVDDALFMRTLIKTMLEKNEYRVVAEAENGADALSVYQEKMPGLLLLDLTLPDMDGVEALRKIVEMDPLANVIMLAPIELQDQVGTCVDNGAKHVLVRPFGEEALMRAVRVTIG